MPSTLITDLAAYWKLDEASGTRSDSAGSSHLTDNNTVTQSSGRVGNAGQFTAANNEYLSVADNAALSSGDVDITVAGWIYLDATFEHKGVLSKGAYTVDLEYFVEHLSDDVLRFGTLTRCRVNQRNL